MFKYFQENNIEEVFIVAELSANHNGSIETAKQSIIAAKKAGANAIKLQTYTPDTITINSKKDDFIIKGTIWEGQNLYSLYSKAFTPWEWHNDLYKLANDLGLICFSSPFDKSSVDFLESLSNPIYKIPSFEITDIPLIEYVASKGKPMIISTGIAEKHDIDLALDSCFKKGNKDIALLKCTSSYPAPIDEANLIMIKEFSKKYNLITGLSDHTLGLTAPIVAVALGAKIIEKHFTLDKKVKGPDSAFSLDFEEFSMMVKAIRETEKSIGNIDYNLTDNQIKGKSFSRSLYVVNDIEKGEIFTHNNIRSIRPGFGLHPKYLNIMIGEKSKKEYKKGDRLEKQ
jgi:pseudaminic acid synthase